MLMPRIIPCLDVRHGRVVKGVRFQNLRDAGDPVERVSAYQAQGADEIAVLDVAATPESREHRVDLVRRLRQVLMIPLTVGGGLKTVGSAERLLQSGADKVVVNTRAVEEPELLDELARRFGSQCTVLALDARAQGSSWEVMTRSGSYPAGLDATAWAREAVSRGVGEILLTSWDRDGTRRGYDLALIETITKAVSVPVIASGGAADASHLRDAFAAGAHAVLAASVFHDNDKTVDDLKRYLKSEGIGVRL